jgi:hypothetical protein
MAVRHRDLGFIIPRFRDLDSMNFGFRDVGF